MSQKGIISEDIRAVGEGWVVPMVTLIDDPLNPMLPPLYFETSRIMDGGTCDLWTDFLTDNELYLTSATDSSCHTFGALVSVLADIRFATVVLEGGVYYLLAVKPSTGTQDIYMWNSVDKTTWLPMNGGAPIFTQSANPASIYRYIWNCGIIVLNGIWHFFIECGTQADQSDVGIGYSYSTLDDLNWDTNRTPTQIVLNGLNPNPILIPDRNAIMMFHGDINRTQQHITDISIHYAYLTENFSLAATWKYAESFNLHYQNIHVADPDFVVAGPTKDHNLILGFNYDQSVQWQQYSDLSLTTFFDRVIKFQP